MTRIVLVESSFGSAWREDVALFTHDESRVFIFNLFNSRVISNRAMLLKVFLDLVWIQTLRVEYACIFLNDADYSGAFRVSSFRKIVAHVTETLYDNFFASQSRAHVCFVAKVIVPSELL